MTAVIIALLYVTAIVVWALWLDASDNRIEAQQRRVEFTAHTDAALDLVADATDQDWRAWEIQCRPTYWRDGRRA